MEVMEDNSRFGGSDGKLRKFASENIKIRKQDGTNRNLTENELQFLSLVDIAYKQDRPRVLSKMTNLRPAKGGVYHGNANKIIWVLSVGDDFVSRD
jgi:hypothetical protein